MRLAAISVAWLLIGLPAAVAMERYQPSRLTDGGEILDDDEFVVLEPETWVGKRFPLLKHIDIGDELAKGEWIVLLYHDDCPKCQEVLPRYERLAGELARASSERRVALVEMLAFAASEQGDVTQDVGLAVRGHIENTKEWFVETPAELLLNGSIVVRAGGRKTATKL